MQQGLTQVTIIYYHDESLELLHELMSLTINEQGMVVLSLIHI